MQNQQLMFRQQPDQSGFELLLSQIRLQTGPLLLKGRKEEKKEKKED
jgi:hypothetical protein